MEDNQKDVQNVEQFSKWQVIDSGDDGDEWETSVMRVPGGWMWLHWVVMAKDSTLFIEKQFIPDPQK